MISFYAWKFAVCLVEEVQTALHTQQCCSWPVNDCSRRKRLHFEVHQENLLREFWVFFLSLKNFTRFCFIAVGQKPWKPPIQENAILNGNLLREREREKKPPWAQVHVILYLYRGIGIRNRITRFILRCTDTIIQYVLSDFNEHKITLHQLGIVIEIVLVHLCCSSSIVQ
jgi:hypothetical protein